jgi:hypothetical protein
MTIRTDIHSPSRIVPSEYEWVAYDYLGSWPGMDLGALMALKVERERKRKHMERTGGKYASHEHGGTCGICGANAAYVSIFHHRPSNEYVVVGWECAMNLERSGDAPGRNGFRRDIRDARKAQAGKRKAQALLADHGLTRCWEIVGEGREESIIRDIVWKLVKYGSISDKQWSFLTKLVSDIDNRAAVAAQRAAEAESAAPVPTGRTQFKGQILSVKSVDGYVGQSVLKMLMKTDEGYKVWGTVPDRMLDIGKPIKGMRAEMRATLQPSKDDPKFGFMKRPVFIQWIDQEAA